MFFQNSTNNLNHSKDDIDLREQSLYSDDKGTRRSSSIGKINFNNNCLLAEKPLNDSVKNSPLKLTGFKLNNPIFHTPKTVRIVEEASKNKKHYVSGLFTNEPSPTPEIQDDEQRIKKKMGEHRNTFENILHSMSRLATESDCSEDAEFGELWDEELFDLEALAPTMDSEESRSAFSDLDHGLEELGFFEEYQNEGPLGRGCSKLYSNVVSYQNFPFAESTENEGAFFKSQNDQGDGSGNSGFVGKNNLEFCERIEFEKN